MLKQFFSKAARLVLPAVIAVSAAGQAYAGLVTGSWDPAFGPSRPGLNWAIEGRFQVPNLCSTQADGVYSTASGDCAGAYTMSLNLRLYNDLADPNNFYELSANSQNIDLHAYSLAELTGGYIISQVRVVAGQVVGFVAGWNGTASSPDFAGFSDPDEAGGTAYGAWLDALKPGVICFQCGENEADLIGSTAGLTQFLVTYDSEDASRPKFADNNRNPLGAVLDEDGNYLGQAPVPGAVGQVPEPGALALVLLALGAAGATSRRR